MSPTKTAPKYNIVENDGQKSSVTLVIGTKSFTATPEHPNFPQIVEGCERGDDPKSIRDLFDASLVVAEKFEIASSSVKVKNGRIYMKNKEVHNAVTEEIIRFHQNELDFMPLVRFMEKIEKNPTEHSRENLYRWIGRHRYALAEDGDIIAYKGVRNDLGSSHGGPGIVNGKKMNGSLPNRPGNVIEMRREDVTWDPHRGCAAGLHVGNWSYASSFASKTVRVKINPTDVVSVPTDSGDQKMRVCRYRVLQEVQQESDALLVEDIFLTAKLIGTDSGVTLMMTEKKIDLPIKRKSRPGKAAAKPKPKEYAFPQFYEDFTKRDFDHCTVEELRWLVREWAKDEDTETLGVGRAPKNELVARVLKAARVRKKVVVR